MAESLPDGFADHREPNGRRVYFRADLAAPLAALGFLSGTCRLPATGRIAGRGSHSIYELPDHAMHVIWKHCRRGGMIEPLLGDRHWNVRRFLDELRLTERARRAGLRVAEIVGLAIAGDTGRWKRVEILTRLEPDAVDLAEALSSAQLSTDLRRAILLAAATELRRFHGLGFLHGDLNVKNLLWRQRESADVEVILIDLDPAGTRLTLSGHTAQGNLLRLLRSYYKGLRRQEWHLSRTELLRFALRYFRGDHTSLRDLWRTLRRRGWLRKLQLDELTAPDQQRRLQL
ncbi:MAG: lipopolysaccharide kinase InaA family protein [Planctomycetota bacterium]